MAAAPLLSLQDVHLTFGGTPLFEGAELFVFERDRLCVVGRNGSGKSTLMKIAAGKVEPDRGDRFVKPGVTIRYLEQEPDFAGFATTLDYAAAGLAHAEDLHRAQTLLIELGLTGEEDPALISGGEARRAAIAAALAPDPDVLLLDEPTNHLDIAVIEWLETTLARSRAALVLISHDRAFLSTLTKRTVWVDRGQSRHLDRGFADFEAWRDKLFTEEEVAAHKLDRKIAAEEDWVRYGVTARRKRNVRRMAELAELRRQKRERRRVQGVAKLDAAESAMSGKLVIEADRVSKSFDRPIVTDFSVKVARGDRVGLVGPNGAGKTTLLALLTGALAPDQGTVRLGTNLDIVALDQLRSTLKLSDTLTETLTGGRGDMVNVGGQQRHVMGYLKDFAFSPEQARSPVSALSGGERGRLSLAAALAKPSNLLVLDEPTNDLDLETLDLLEDALAAYAGTVILVSHDRDFLNRLVTSVIAPAGPTPTGQWIEYAGGYTDMISQRAEDQTAGSTTAPESAGPGRKKANDAPKPKTTSKLSYKDKYALETLPQKIDQLTAAIASHAAALADPDLFTRDPAAFETASQALAAAQADLEAAETHWLELEMKREELEG